MKEELFDVKVSKNQRVKENPEKNVITVAPINVHEVEESKKDSEVVLSSVKDLKIIDNTAYQWAGNFLRTIAGKISALDDRRKSITRPLDQAKKSIKMLFDEPIHQLENARETVDTSMRIYSAKQKQIRLDNERRLQAEADRKRREAEKKAEEFRAKGKEEKATEWEEKAETIVAPTLAPSVPKVEGISYRDHWSAEVVDRKLVPDEYLIPNMLALNKIAIAMKGSIKIPGIQWKCEKILATRK